ncbi:ABC transporter substrate-binding protein [Cohnella sp. GCM10012308]|uniref:ABC transporter substrate-binding protein n=1 Tax=Cohnella sp. GCM10012308 TaxID=3317329 RepID=UPI00360F0A03
MKKLSMLALAAVMTSAALAGCGSNDSSDKPAASSAAASSSEGTTPSAASGKPVTLKFMTYTYADRTKSTDAWIKDMKDKHNITIELQNVPTDQYETAVKTKLAAGDIPDLLMTHTISKDLTLYGTQMDPDLFLDISDVPSVSQYIPSVVADAKDNKAGKLYFVPVSTNALGVLYNKKTFSDNAIAVPTDRQAFEAASDKLKSAGLIPIAGGFKDSWTTQIIPFIAYGQYINAKDMTTRIKIADGTMKASDIADDFKKVLAVQQDWRDRGYFPKDFLGTDANVASTMVGTGKAAMLVSGTWQYKAIQDADPKAQIGFFALPLNGPGEKTVVPTSASGGLVISAKTANPEAAKLAMDVYLSAENQTRIMTDLNGIPTNTQVKVDNAFVADINAAMAAGDVQPDWWGVNYYHPASLSGFAPDKEFQSLLADGTTPERFIEDYDKGIAQALEAAK